MDMAAIAASLLVAARPHAALARVRCGLSGLGWALGAFALLGGYQIWLFLFGAQHIVGPTHPEAFFAAYHADLLSAIVPTPVTLL